MSTRIKAFILLCLILGFFYFFRHHDDPSGKLVSLFPIQNYDQNISHWIKPTDPDYQSPLLTPALQKMRYNEWYDRNYGANSPWSKNHVAQVCSVAIAEHLSSIEQEIIHFFGNQSKSTQRVGYGSNYRPYPAGWMQDLQPNMNLKQFDMMHYDPARRAIAVTNSNARLLPTQEVHFYSAQIPGQGYPFDNLAVSIVWAGTPLYILGETLAHDWSLVLTPSFVAWIKNTDLARADDEFVNFWEQSANKNLVAITQTDFPIRDIEDKAYRFSGYIGMAFPGTIENDQIRILIPVSDEKRMARIHSALLSSQQAILMPMLPTPQNFAKMMSQLIGRPYGWGGIYFHNDCALELKSLYTPFGIWLPMRSFDQTNEEQFKIKVADLSKSHLSDRLAYLTKNGHKLMTLVTVEGHVFMFVGSYPNPKNLPHQIPLSYQNVWALHLKKNTGRLVIGKAVLLPILPKYPEGNHLLSQADEKYFKMAWLDLPPETQKSPRIDLRGLLDFAPKQAVKRGIRSFSD